MILLELMKILWSLMMYMGLVLRMIDQNWETNWILLMIPNLQSPKGGNNQIYIVEFILMYLSMAGSGLKWSWKSFVVGVSQIPSRTSPKPWED